MTEESQATSDHVEAEPSSEVDLLVIISFLVTSICVKIKVLLNYIGLENQ